MNILLLEHDAESLIYLRHFRWSRSPKLAIDWCSKRLDHFHAVSDHTVRLLRVFIRT